MCIYGALQMWVTQTNSLLSSLGSSCGFLLQGCPGVRWCGSKRKSLAAPSSRGWQCWLGYLHEIGCSVGVCLCPQCVFSVLKEVKITTISSLSARIRQTYGVVSRLVSFSIMLLKFTLWLSQLIETILSLTLQRVLWQGLFFRHDGGRLGKGEKSHVSSRADVAKQGGIWER